MQASRPCDAAIIQIYAVKKYPPITILSSICE